MQEVITPTCGIALLNMTLMFLIGQANLGIKVNLPKNTTPTKKLALERDTLYLLEGINVKTVN